MDQKGQTSLNHAPPELMMGIALIIVAALVQRYVGPAPASIIQVFGIGLILTPFIKVLRLWLREQRAGQRLRKAHAYLSTFLEVVVIGGIYLIVSVVRKILRRSKNG